MPRRFALAVLFAALFTADRAPAEMRAEQITAETAPLLQIGGPDAIGGIGDWYLANDVVEIIVDDPGRRFATLNHGGTIVDAGLLDRTNEDQFARLFPIVNMDQRIFIGFDKIRAEVDAAEGWARLLVSNSGHLDSVARNVGLTRFFDPLVPAPDELANVAVETEYAVFRGEPFVHINTTFRNTGPTPAPIMSYGDVWMRGGRSGRAFVGNTLDPERTSGFHHLSFDRRNILSSGESMAAFTHVSVPGVPAHPGIAYAIFAPERGARRLRQFGVTGEHVTLINAYVGDPDWHSLSLVRLAKAVRSELAPGHSWSFRRRLLITGHADVASTTDVIFPLLDHADGKSGISGRVEPADVRHVIHVTDLAAGAPITEIATATTGSAAGTFRAILPPGEYRLSVRAEQRAPQELDVTVPQGGVSELPLLQLESPGWLVFSPAFADGGPGRIIVQGGEAGSDPVFGDELLDFRLDGELVESGSAINELYFLGSNGDPTRIAIAPGRYRLTATRGLEYTAAVADVSVTSAGEVTVAPFAIERVVEVPGGVSSDLHVHAQASDDSAMTNTARLASFIAEGVQVIVTTDHDHLGFFEPALDSLGVRDRIRVVQGVEMTSSAPSPLAAWSIGHHNAWPIPYQPLEHRQGAPPVQNMRLADLYASVRHTHGASVIQMNHPRDSDPGEVDEGSFLTHLGDVGEGFDPKRPITAEPNDRLLEVASDGVTRAIDFDAIEVMNGRSFGKFLRVRDDWYSLLRQGYVRTGTANSDTHGPGQPAGYPRNYVFPESGSDTEDESWDESAWSEAIRAGRSFGSNGPLITDFRANGVGMGGRALAPDGRAVVEFTVAAAPWVPVDEVRLLVNGNVVTTYTGSELAPDAVVRLRQRSELVLTQDAFVTLEAGAPLAAESDAWGAAHPGLYASVIARGFVPTAFANPIFLDVDGNGRFDAPGLPPEEAGPLGAWVAAVVAVSLLALRVRRRRRRRRA